MYKARQLVFSAVISIPLASLGCGGHAHNHLQPETRGEVVIGNPSPGLCPVMGEEVDVDKAAADPILYADYKGKRYLFCCRECKPKFERDADKYIAGAAAPGKEKGPATHGDHAHQH